MDGSVINVLGIDIQFPYKIYEPQKLCIEAIVKSIEYGQNAIIESPTGTGKTLCILCASLAYLYEKRIPGLKIIYTTRTHGQLHHIFNELKKVSYYDKLREKGINVTILGSRDKLCVHSRGCKMKGDALSGYCKALVQSRTCTYYNGYRSKEYKNVNTCVDVEDLTTLGRKHGFCPFYMVKEAHKTSNFILMPYNYLLSQTIRSSIELDLANSVIIIDEAHNIDDFAERVVSFNISQMDVTRSIDALKRVITNVNDCIYDRDEDISDLNQLVSLSIMLQKLDQFLMMLHLDDKRMKCKIKRVNFVPIVDKFDEKFIIFDTLSFVNAISPLIFDNKTHNNLEMLFEKLIFLITATSKNEGFKKILNFEIQSIERLKKSLIQLTSSWFQTNYHHFYTVLRLESSNNDYKTDYRNILFECMNATCTFTKLNSEKIRNFILTSGTLSPIDNFISNIGGGVIKFPIILENNHVVGKDRIWVGGISSKLKLKQGEVGGEIGNFDQQELISTYDTRSNVEYIYKLGVLLKIFINAVPGGILCFFASYTNMIETIQVWEKSGIYRHLSFNKQIFIEKTKYGDQNVSVDYLSAFKNAVDNNRGALFFAVFRGKMAEGIDFSNDYCRGIFICGIPYPNTHDFRVSLKINYLFNAQNTSKKVTLGSGDKKHNWYTLAATKAVNQAIGRCIRHVNDYGAILLADIRYEYKNMQSQLSKWALRSLEIYSSINALSSSLDKFFLKFQREVKNHPLNPINDIFTTKIVNLTNSDDEKTSNENCKPTSYQHLIIPLQGRSHKRERNNTSASALLGLENDEVKSSKNDVKNPFASWSTTGSMPFTEFSLN